MPLETVGGERQETGVLDALIEFFEKASMAKSLVEVNIAAGLALEALLNLT